jgi:branched-subunit amino acid aminotransferase/4-amino-4-deoxychorismate lyase
MSANPSAYLNGEKIPAAEAQVSVFDLGFTMGVSVTEQIRTYRRQTPLIERHLNRLFGGLEIIGLAAPFSREELTLQVQNLVSENGRDLDDNDELGIGICITPGLVSAYGQTNAGLTTLVYTYVLKASDQKAAIERGIRLTSVATTEIPASSVPKALKCRSRMHYYLAEREARATDPDSRALLHDTDGFVAEGTTASVIIVSGGEIIAPLKEAVLPGVTLGYALELADGLGIPIQRRDITRDELESADEAMWLTTPVGIVPVSHVNGQAIDKNTSGDITRRLSEAWQSAVGAS